jgi:DNA modification methylase
MAKRAYKNRLNDLDPKSWLKFQKSWFIHNPPPRRKEVLLHPAKFPETLAQEFIEFFTKSGQLVLDPMVGTGSTLVAAMRAGRNSVGIELNPKYAEISQIMIQDERIKLGEKAANIYSRVFQANAQDIRALAITHQLPVVDYVFTSPPYWDMLHARGAENQKIRRENHDLDVVYSTEESDLGNIPVYEDFLERLISIYRNLDPLLKPGAYLTIIVKNIKKGGKIYPLAWDLAASMAHFYSLKDEKIWCQDDVRLAPYGLGSAWVSNTFHHYCLQFRKD